MRVDQSLTLFSRFNFSALLASLVLITFVLTGCGRDKPEDALLAKARELVTAKQYIEARNTLSQYFGYNDSNADAYMLLGEISEKLGDKPAALNAYSKVVGLRSEHVEARLKAAGLFLGFGDLKQAENVLNYVREFRPNDPELLTLEAAIFHRRGDTPQAIERAEKLIAARPKALEPSILLNDLYRQAGEWEKAEKITRDALVHHAGNATLRYNLALNLLGQRRFGEAEQLLRDLVEQEPDVLLYAGRLAELYTGQTRHDEAEELLRRAVQRDPNDERRVLVLANFLAKTRGGFVAEEELVNAMFARPGSVVLRVALGELYETMLNLDGAERVYREAADIAKDPVQKRNALVRAARVLLRLGEINGAEPLVGRILAEDPRNIEARLLRAKVLMTRGRFDAAIEDFRTVLNEQPQSLEILGMLVRAYVANGQSDLAEQGLRSAVSMDPTHVAMRIELVQMLGMQRRYTDALAEIDDLLSHVPFQLDALLRRTDLYLAINEWDKALASAREVRDRYPDSAAGYLQLGNIYFLQTLYDRAADAYRLALERFPLEHNALYSLSQAIFVKEGPSAAKRYLEGFLDSYPNHPTAYNVLGEIYFQENEHTKAEAAFVKAYQLNPTWLEPYKNLARLYEARGEDDAVIQTYLNGLLIIPDNVQLAYLLAQAYARSGKTDDAIATYEGILNKRPYIDYVSNSLATLLLRQDKPNLDRVWGLVEKFHTANNSVFLDTLGWTYYYRKEYDNAVAVLQRALKISPNLIEAKYHLGMVYNKRGEKELAAKWLGEALATRVRFHGYDKAKALHKRLLKEN